jgi:hypothetical protein
MTHLPPRDMAHQPYDMASNDMACLHAGAHCTSATNCCGVCSPAQGNMCVGG